MEEAASCLCSQSLHKPVQGPCSLSSCCFQSSAGPLLLVLVLPWLWFEKFSWTSLEHPSLGVPSVGQSVSASASSQSCFPCRVQSLLPQILLQIHPLSPL